MYYYEISVSDIRLFDCGQKSNYLADPHEECPHLSISHSLNYNNDGRLGINTLAGEYQPVVPSILLLFLTTTTNLTHSKKTIINDKRWISFSYSLSSTILGKKIGHPLNRADMNEGSTVYK